MAGTAGAQARYEYAGFWIRTAAHLIDTFITIAILFGLALLTGVVVAVFVHAFGLTTEDARRAGQVFGFVGTYAIGVTYQAAFLTGRWQATPGKRLCGIYVVKADGSKLTTGRAVGRYFSYFISTFTWGIGYAMAGWTDQKKALHDMICETRVVYGKL